MRNTKFVNVVLFAAAGALPACATQPSEEPGGKTFTGCAQVPGDYATLQSAVAALEGPGGTICLSAGAYDGVTISSLGSNPLVISGDSAATTSVSGFNINVGTGCSPCATPSSITLQELSVSNLNATLNGVLNLVHDVVLPQNGAAVALGVDYGYVLTANITSSQISARNGDDAISGVNNYNNAFNTHLNIVLVGDDLSSQAGTAVFGEAVGLVAQNSYIHDSATGISLGATLPSLNGGTLPSLNAQVENNTFARNALALGLNNGSTAAYFNNLFVGNQLAVDYEVAQPLNFGANAYWQNTANFGGFALDTTTDVKTDPLLDGSTPPGLGVGSPCLGAGDPSHAPSTDFFGNPRGSAPDIGAVQSRAPVTAPAPSA
jgi:hypothetical protein